jgi:hypothetical protein
VVRCLLTHPRDDRFDFGEFCGELLARSFSLCGSREVLGLGGFVVATKFA